MFSRYYKVMYTYLSSAFTSIKLLIYPPTCLYCHSNDIMSYHDLCIECWKQINFVNNFDLSFCLKKLNDHAFYGSFYNSSSPQILFVATAYKGIIRELIHRFKFENHRYLADFFAKILKISLLKTAVTYNNNIPLSEAFKLQNNTDKEREGLLIIPVPLHPSKLNERTYNQASLLAQGLGKLTKLSCIPDFLIKTRRSSAQSTLSFERRMQNVNDIFSLNPKYIQPTFLAQFRLIFIIDDVITTGATILNCVKAVKQGYNQYLPGSEPKIYGMSVAHTQDRAQYNSTSQ